MLRKLWGRLSTSTNKNPKQFIPPIGMHIGEGVRVFGQPRIKIVQGAEVICQNGVVLNSNPEGYHAGMAFPVTLLVDRPGAKIIIGMESRLHGCCIHAWSQIIIGRKCLFASGSQLLDSNGHATELEYARLRTIIEDEPDEIELGDYCWIGINSLILKGAHLGEGCIVAALSTVLKGDYPAFSLLAGSPARVIRQLKPEEVYPENYPIDELPLGKKQIYKY